MKCWISLKYVTGGRREHGIQPNNRIQLDACGSDCLGLNALLHLAAFANKISSRLALFFFVVLFCLIIEVYGISVLIL